MSTPHIQIKLFGAFRKYSDQGEITVATETALTLGQVKSELLERLSANRTSEEIKNLLSQSAIATDRRVLEESELVLPGMNLAILPPVCGG
jgi:molybdopterin converting factor small subunit